MGKRIASGVLWFLAASYLGAWVAHLAGLPDLVGPVMGLAASLFFAGDPLGVFWGPTAPTGRTAVRLQQLATDN